MSAKHIAMLLAGLALAACDNRPENTLTGYAEGDYVYVAAPEGGWVKEVLVQRGAEVKIGQPLFSLDTEAQLAQRDQAAAQLTQAQAQLANVQKGRRPDEIATFEAALNQARANRDFAAGELKRVQELSDKGLAAQRTLQSARSQAEVADAQVRTAQANLDLSRQGARSDEIAAAQANVAAAKAALDRAEYVLNQRRVLSKVNARVEDTLRRTGEFVPAGGAVISLLPPGNLKVRFFVPEAVRAKLAVGGKVVIACDGCAANLSATIAFIASAAEFTPPVIYSIGSREKLVWLVEAEPSAGTHLRPGQPVDVTLP